MVRQKDVLSRRGITQKDKKEMVGCMTFMIIFPIYIVIEGMRIIYSFVNKKSNKE